MRLQMIRLHRLAEHPHDIALGVALGVYISFTPLLGFHLILATVLCIIFGGSKIAAWIGTIIGNPLTFPFFFWADYLIGTKIMGFEQGSVGLSQLTSPDVFLDWIDENYWPTLLGGGLILGPIVAILFYYLTYRFIHFSRKRHHRRMAKARARYQALLKESVSTSEE